MYSWQVITRNTDGTRSRFSVTARCRDSAISAARHALAGRGVDIADLVSVALV